MKRIRAALSAMAAISVVLTAAPLSPAAAATATITLSPASGAVGASVTVAGSGFPERASAKLVFGTTSLRTFNTTNRGTFSVQVTVPSGYSGSTAVTVTAGSTVATQSFSVTTATTTTTTIPTPTPTPTPQLLGRIGTALTLGGVQKRFTGLNAYHLASDFSINYGCGDNNQQTDLDAFFSSLRPVSVVRLWAFQHLMYNKNTGQLDFTTLDRVVQTAERYGHKLVLVVANQTGNCDTPDYKDEAWYAGGYRQVFNPGTYNGGTSGPTTPLSFWDYLHTIVPRYANSPAVAIWQPVNEPRDAIINADGTQTCSSTAAATLRKFFDDIGGEIHRMAPNQLVGSGVIGQGNCGAKGAEYQTLHESPGIDIGSYHDYNYDTSAMPGDQWNGLAVRINQMNAVGKPLMIDEAGMKAADGVAGCMTLAQRRDYIKAKMDAQLANGIDIYMPWVWTKSTTNSCSHNIKAGDPTLTLLKSYPL